MQEDKDDNKELYELTGKKVSRTDMHNILNYAIEILLMHDTATI